MLDNKDLVLPTGSLILVTGANGYIASNVVKECLDAGYKVRGTVRSQNKAIQSAKLFHHPDYEAVEVPDMQAAGAFDQAVKGVAAIMHVATVATFDPNPKNVVPATVAGAVGILNSALKEPTVKRFVYTSSAAACTLPKLDTVYRIDRDTWNTDVSKYADMPPPYNQDMAFPVYALSKVRAERAVWDFVREKKPHFVVNAVNPAFTAGRVLGSAAVTAQIIIDAFRGKIPWDFPSEYVVNVVDCARLHVAAAVDGSLADERILAFDERFNWNDIIRAMKELRPEVPLPEVREGLPRNLCEVDNTLGAELLRKWWGQDGYSGLKESIRQNIEVLW